MFLIMGVVFFVFVEIFSVVLIVDGVCYLVFVGLVFVGMVIYFGIVYFIGGINFKEFCCGGCS